MEPQEPARNDDGSGFSKRRISSILKAPRKSVVEQQENKVEYPKPVEKRSSRRVSFAPANDVLLFSEDVKNASPARSPLEELIAASATTSQNSFQVAVAGGSQQIFGMETLLNAPLYASQQREKVNFNTGEDCGEKTVMFSADDVFLDLTHSHTINIATDAELLADIPHQNDDVLPTDGEKLMFTADNRSMDVTRSHTVNMTSGSVLLPTGRKMDLSVEKKNVSSLLPCLDPEFANFIASLSKPCDPSNNLMVTKVTPACSEETNSSLAPVKTKRPDVDKENQVPTFIMRKSLNRSRKTGDSSYGSALCSDDGVSKDVTEAQTGHILGSTDDDYDDDDPFQCLFPTQEMYSQYGKRVSQTAEMLKAKQQQCSKTLVSSDHKGSTTENRAPKLITEDGCRQMTDTTYLKNPVHASQRHKDNFDECSERTVMFTADNEFMDQTRSHTVTIASGILASPPISADGLDPEFKNFFASLSNPCDCSGNPMISKMGPTTSGSSKDSTNMISSLCQLKTAQADKNKENQLVNSTRSFGQSFSTSAMCSENDESMDMTEAHTGHIRGCTGSVDPFQFLLPTQVNECLKKAEMISGQKNSEPLRSSNHKGTETSLKPSLKTKMQRHQAKFDTANDYRQKTDDACMNVTQSYTANIAADFGLQAHHKVDLLSTRGETTVMFTADATDMDMTQCLTVNIASNLVSDSVVPVKKQEGLPRNRSSSAHSLNPGFSNFLTSLSNQSDPSVDFVITRVTPPTVQSSNTGDSSNGSAKYPEGDVRIDMTEPQTGRILGMAGTDDPLQCHFPMKDKYPQSNNLERAEMTSQRLSWEALGSSNREDKEIPNQSHSVNTGAVFKPQSRQNVDLLPTCGEKTVRFFANDEAMDITQSHTVSIATACEPQLQQNLDVPTCSERTVRFSTNDAIMDMTQSHTVNIAAVFKPQSCQNLDLPTCGEKTVKFSTNDATMDITQSHTVNIATAFDPQSQQNLDLPTCGEKTVKFSTNDATMDITRSHTVNIATSFDPQSQQNLDVPTCGEKTVKFSTNDATMDITQSHTVNIATSFDPQSQQNLDVPTCGEKTVKFSTNDATMDITQSHTVNIATAFGPQSQQNLDVPTCGEKTVRFSTNDPTMDITQSHTVNIATAFDPQSQHNLDLPTCGEKTMKFSTNDATMEITRSHTVNIATACEQQSQRNLDLFSACKEKTVLFTANDATMDVTQSHTVNIATAFEHQSHKNVDLPPCGEKTVRFTANDAAMDMTQCLAVNIPSHMVSDSVPPCQYLNTATTNRNMDLPLTVRRTESGLHRTRSSSVHGLNSGLKNSLSKTSGLGTNPVITKAVALAEPSAQEGVEANDYMEQLDTQGPDVDGETLTPGVIPCTMDNPQNQIMTGCLEDDVNMGVTKAHLYPESNHMKKTEATSQQSSEALGSSNPGAVETTNQPHSSDSDEPRARKEPELKNETSPQKMEGSPRLVDQHDDILHSPKSRRKSIVSLLSKIKRLSHVINTAPDPIVMDSCTVPLPQLDHDLDQNSKDKTKSLSVVEPELKLGIVNAEDKTQAQCLTDREQTTATPFNLKTNQLMSRLSMGGFKPKLPQRSKPDDQQKVNYVGERRGTIKTDQLSNFDSDVSDIHDEELGSYEDVSETPDTSPQKIEDHSQEFIMDESLEENGFEEDFTSAARGQKRPLPEDKSIMEDEKRMKASIVTTDTTEMDLQSHAVECDANIITGPSMTTHTDCSSIRCEATFESTFKNSLFESQLEDYATDLQKKLDDGTITVSEFFKLFNIDFVIHNPRQSVLSGRLLSNTDRTLMDLFKDKHISHPKQMVYEADVQNLTKKVEGLKVRMRDLDRPLKMVNRPLWEEIRNSSEKELKPFGAKLKERNTLFRKMSKTRSHEMKEALYSNLVQPNLEVQQKLRGTIEKAEEMRKTLDDCICELETELAAVEEKGTEDKPSLTSRQEELKNITEALADSERQISELKIEKKKNSDKLCRLKAETRSMESHLDVLHTVNEYKFGGKRDNCTTYTFLYETMHLQVVYENSNGNDADNGPEQNISHITLKLELDEEKSKCHARLVHKLLSQYTEGESAWVEKYPTRRHIPQLLHDVGLVVSCCRLLGEELRLLKMWGGLRLDILDISCVDAQVQIVFSSLKKLSKFEVVFSVSLINQLYVLQLQSFKNIIGSTTMQQIEEIVALFTPGRNLLTKIVKKIHDKLLC